ncbi:hypothetical protein ACWM35_12265 [Neobacillus sp. K501]
MTTSNTTIDEKYEAAIQSLKKVNDELFYDELKELINEREEVIVEKNEAVYDSIEKMSEILRHFPSQLSEQFKEEVMDPQSLLFNQGMERLNENLVTLEEKASEWQKEYQAYLKKTEALLADLNKLKKDDHDFIQAQTEKILKTVENQLESKVVAGIKEQESLANQHFEIFSQQFQYLLHELHILKSNQISLDEEWTQRYLEGKEEQKKLEKQLDERFELAFKKDRNKENVLKKWLLGLGIGQGITMIVLILQFFL